MADERKPVRVVYWYRGQPAPKLPPYKTGDGETRVNDADLDARIAAVVASLIADRHAGPEGVRAVVREELRALAKFFWTRDPQMARDLDTYLKAEPMKLQFTNEWLRKKIATDPDDEPEAGAPFGRAPREPAGEDAPLSVSHLKKLLEHRDAFIVANGLWEKFVASIATPPAVPMGYREAAADIPSPAPAESGALDIAAHLHIINFVADMEDKRAACQRARELRAAAAALAALQKRVTQYEADALRMKDESFNAGFAKGVESCVAETVRTANSIAPNVTPGTALQIARQRMRALTPSPAPDAPPDLPEWKPTHRHYKGGLYRVVALGRYEETMLPVVIYESQDGSTWVRSKIVFDETVTHEGVIKPRFAKLTGSTP